MFVEAPIFARDHEKGLANNKQVVSRSPLDYDLDSAATYIIAGGLGGIGRSIAEWMCRQGARHLILLSRSGPKSAAAQLLVSTLEKAGVVVYTPSCDISDSDAVQTVVKYAKVHLPPIKGCIQASMVVEVSDRSNISARMTKS